MTDDQSTGTIKRDRWFEALDWHTALEERADRELPLDKVYAWQQWVADSENRQVFDQVAQLVGNCAQYPTPTRPSQEEVDNDLYDASIPLAQWRASRANSMAPSNIPNRVRWWKINSVVAIRTSVAGVVACCVALLLFILWRTMTPGERLETYQTNSGEIRKVWLEDGSSVVLGAQSSLLVKFTPEHRSVRLERGEALFQVAHNRFRPFVVTAGQRTITATGTAFVVRRDSDRVIVTVTDGSVEVVAPTFGNPTTPTGQPGDSQLLNRSVARVVRGQQMSYEDQGAVGPIQHADPQMATAWAHGRLQFEDESLRYVVETVNRYSRREIIVDPASADFRYTGLVFPDQIDDWACGLENIYPVEVLSRGALIEVHPRGDSPSPQQFCRQNR
jgi:transmembrane sensor